MLLGVVGLVGELGRDGRARRSARLLPLVVGLLAACEAADVGPSAPGPAGPGMPPAMPVAVAPPVPGSTPTPMSVPPPSPMSPAQEVMPPMDGPVAGSGEEPGLPPPMPNPPVSNGPPTEPEPMEPEAMEPEPVEPGPMEPEPMEPEPMEPGADPEPGRLSGFTAAHNAVRAELSLPPLSWSPEIAEFAQEWADELAANCGAVGHRNQDSYGENIASYGAAPNPPGSTPEQVVQSWAAEVACWDYGPFMRGDACDGACISAMNSTGCGHYTQVVWNTTTRVGCGMATCQSGRFTFELWVCNYDPPGNFVGQTPY